MKPPYDPSADLCVPRVGRSVGFCVGYFTGKNAAGGDCPRTCDFYERQEKRLILKGILRGVLDYHYKRARGAAGP